MSPDPEHQYNLPEGFDYDIDGAGLINKKPVAPDPFPENPLESLNKTGGEGL